MFCLTKNSTACGKTIQAILLHQCYKFICIFTALTKPKQYDWKDSNLALFGSDTDKQVKSEYIDTRYLTGFEIPGSRGIQDVLLFMIKF